METKSTNTQYQSHQGSSRISVLAVVSAALSFIFFLPVISGMGAIILGVIALNSITEHQAALRGRGFAITGIVVGSLQILLIAGLLATGLYVRQQRILSRAVLNNSQSAASPKKDYGHSVGANDFISRNNRALALYESGRAGEALELFQSALEVARKEEGIARHGIGSVYMNKGEYQKALAEFDKAIEAHPTLYDAYQNKAVTLRLMGRFRDSVNACQETIRNFPDFPRAWCSMGWAYEHLGKYNEAVAAHLEAIRLSPEWEFPRTRIDLCLSQIDDARIVQEVRAQITYIETEARRD